MHSNKIINICVVFFTLITCEISALSGEREYSFQDLVNNSDYIIKGKVVSINSFKGSYGRIYSNITFEISDVYKGQLASTKQILFTVLGGKIDGIKMIALETPQFINDEESILFISEKVNSKNETKYFITGGSQGKFNLYTNQSKQMISRDKFVDSFLELPSTGGVSISNSDKIDMKDFISALSKVN